MAFVNPSLVFDGNAEDAMRFYKSVFGGEFSEFQRFEDVPEGVDWPVADADKRKVMHCSLPLKDGVVLMACDAASGMSYQAGTNFSVSVNPDSEDEARRIFNALSAGGTVTMPMDKTFWNALFGMFTDKFGINWMVNYQLG